MPTPKKVEMDLTMSHSILRFKEIAHIVLLSFSLVSPEKQVALNLVAHLVGLSTYHIAASTHTAP